MTKHEQILLFEYILHKEQFLKNDLIQLENNLNYRNSDCLDHLEIVIAKVKIETAQQVFEDLKNLFPRTLGNIKKL